MVARIKYSLFKAVYSFTITKCYIKILKQRRLTKRCILVIITATVYPKGAVKRVNLTALCNDNYNCSEQRCRFSSFEI